MSQVETGKIFPFMNVKRFKRRFSLQLHTIVYEIKSLGSLNFGQVTGNRGALSKPSKLYFE